MEIRDASSDDFPKILKLYRSTGWIHYTNNPAMLESAVRQSLKVLIAWEDNQVVGIIRAVGDGASILYIQDIIVSPEYRRQGIGKALLIKLDSLFPQVYQKILLTDDQPRSLAFYERCGFSECGKYRCTAMAKFNV